MGDRSFVSFVSSIFISSILASIAVIMAVVIGIGAALGKWEWQALAYAAIPFVAALVLNLIGFIVGAVMVTRRW